VNADRPHSRDAWDDDDHENYADIGGELDGFPDYPSSSPIDDNEDDWTDDNRQQTSAEGDETFETLIVTATSPSGSVTATALMDGRVFEVKLSSEVTKQTESELSAEILAVCKLANRQAEAAQHYIVANLMRRLGHDPASTRAFLERTIGLPSPQAVLEEKARMFADYLSSNRDRNESSAW
jgi:DNA-binding protein YbaB